MRKVGIVIRKLMNVAGALLVFLPFAAAPVLSMFGQSKTLSSLHNGCGTMDSNFGDEPCIVISFVGRVTANHSFDRQFGNLLFRLNSQDAASGWNIEVVSAEEGSSTSSEYVWPVTPPYHFGNVRYLDTSYGVRADQAVKQTPRDFNFVLGEAQFLRAAELVDLGISSRPVNDHQSAAKIERESKDALAVLESLPVGKGRLEIIDSHVDKSAGRDGLGAIEWLKFKVELHVPCDFEVVGSTDIFIDRASCSDDEKKLN